MENKNMYLPIPLAIVTDQGHIREVAKDLVEPELV
jgi:hypothetical protein